MDSFEGKVGVVTGGGSGIGRAICLALAEAGADVAVADIDADNAAKVAEEVSGKGARGLAVTTDVTQPDSVAALASSVVKELGGADVVCNNAGVARAPGGGKMWEYDLNDWNWILSVNVMGVVHGIRSFVPVLLEQGDEGHVVNTSSGNGGISPLRGLPIYAASKSAVTHKLSATA